MQSVNPDSTRPPIPVQTLLAFFCLPFFVVPSAAQSPQQPPALAHAHQQQLAAWLDSHGQQPERYVVGLFSDHDVVFLGEQHRVSHDVLLLQALLEPLYRAGVRVVAYEFGRRVDQPLIDWLLVRSEWDEGLAREIVFRNFMAWGYREYVDVYKVAWELNRRLPKGAPPLRIIGINNSPDWSLLRTPDDRQNPKLRRVVLHGEDEEDWAEPILAAVAAGEKVLVFSGIHHAFTKYRQPYVSGGEFKRFGDIRCGNHVFQALGERTFTVFLHAPWRGYEGYGSALRHPADGVIDSLMLAIGPRPVGFSLKPGPFGALPVGDAVYRHGYADFKLSDFCDGWIYTKPISEFEGVKPIPDWINEDNLDRARQQSPNPASRGASAQDLKTGIARDADIPARWGHLR